jgi:hypothetical protein
MDLLRRASDGSIVLWTKRPRDCLTWHWSVSLKRRALASNVWRIRSLAAERRDQWHDYYRLPFGWWLTVSRQDYHRAHPGDQSDVLNKGGDHG